MGVRVLLSAAACLLRDSSLQLLRHLRPPRTRTPNSGRRLLTSACTKASLIFPCRDRLRLLQGPFLRAGDLQQPPLPLRPQCPLRQTPPPSRLLTFTVRQGRAVWGLRRCLVPFNLGSMDAGDPFLRAEREELKGAAQGLVGVECSDACAGTRRRGCVFFWGLRRWRLRQRISKVHPDGSPLPSASNG